MHRKNVKGLVPFSRSFAAAMLIAAMVGSTAVPAFAAIGKGPAFVSGTEVKAVDYANHSLDQATLEKVVASFNSQVNFVDVNGNIIPEGSASFNIPETADSFPYLSMKNGRSKVNVGFEDKYDYAEYEFFLSGNANVYSNDANNKVSIDSEGNAYTNRVIVFMPKDASKFKGEVFVDILNASSKVDVPDLWRRGHDYFMRNGYAYVGITSKDCNVDALKKFDAERYKTISWSAKETGNTNVKNYKSRDINSTFYDMLGQLGVMLHKAGTPLLNGQTAKHVYLMGQSQSGWYTNTYSNCFGQANYIGNNGQPIYEGIINVVGGAKDAPLSSNSTLVNDRRGEKPLDSPVPFVLFVGENDYNPAPVKPDADEEGKNIYRHYMVAGGPHSKKIFSPDPIDAIGVLAGRKAGYDASAIMDKNTNKPHTVSNFNMDSFFNTVVDNVVKYVNYGTKLPKGNAAADIPGKLGLGMGGKVSVYFHDRNSDGNVTSGIVSPQISVPVAAYYGGANNEASTDGGTMIYFDQAKIDSMYTDKRDYIRQYEAELDKLIAQRYLMQGEKEAMMKLAYNTPVFNHRLSFEEYINKGMLGQDTVLELKKSEDREGYKLNSYSMNGNANIYTVYYADQPYVRKKDQHFTTPVDVYIPNGFNGEKVVIGLRYNGHSFDPSELLNKGVCYIELAADPAEAEANGGSWKVLSEKVASPIPNKDEAGLLWDIISQTASHVNELTGQTVADVYLGSEADDAAAAYTYEAVFNNFEGYRFKGVGFGDIKLQKPEKLSALCSVDATYPVETLSYDSIKSIAPNRSKRNSTMGHEYRPSAPKAEPGDFVK